MNSALKQCLCNTGYIDVWNLSPGVCLSVIPDQIQGLSGIPVRSRKGGREGEEEGRREGRRRRREGSSRGRGGNKLFKDFSPGNFHGVCLTPSS